MLKAIAIAAGVLLIAVTARWVWWRLAWRRMPDEERARVREKARRQMLRRLVEVNVRRALKGSDRRGRAQVLSAYADFAEEYGDVKDAVRAYRQAGLILSEMDSPDVRFARDNLDRLRRWLGDAEFNRVLHELDEEQKDQNGGDR